MTIYSSDYIARTHEMENERKQRVRESALQAAAAIVVNDSVAFHGNSSQQRARTVVTVARAFEQYILTGKNTLA